MTSAKGSVASVSVAIQALRDGDRRVLSRLLSVLEDGTSAGPRVMEQLRAEPRSGHASVLAVTGPPGVGKSTLVAALARMAADEGAHVAVLAVDPSSHVTGGAVLGDRIRMMGEVGEGVFIRSFANRGVAGGLARAVPAALELVEAAGYDLIVVETVGVGQSEIDVARLAEVTVVVLAPNLGDGVQAVKAGVMEIADAYIVNKCDLPDASRAVREVQASTQLRHVGKRDVPVLSTAAVTGEGLTEVWTALTKLLRAAAEDPAVARRRITAARVDELGVAAHDLLRQAAERGSTAPDSILGRVLDERMSVAEASARLEEWLTEADG